MQIQISWLLKLLQKLTDLDLQDISGFSMARVNSLFVFFLQDVPQGSWFLDIVGKQVGFPAVDEPFKPVALVVSDCPITYTSYLALRKKRDVHLQTTAPASQRRKRQVVTYDVNTCDSVFSSSTLAT